MFIHMDVQQGFFLAFRCQVALENKIWLKNTKKIPRNLDGIAKKFHIKKILDENRPIVDENQITYM